MEGSGSEQDNSIKKWSQKTSFIFKKENTNQVPKILYCEIKIDDDIFLLLVTNMYEYMRCYNHEKIDLEFNELKRTIFSLWYKIASELCKKLSYSEVIIVKVIPTDV